MTDEKLAFCPALEVRPHDAPLPLHLADFGELGVILLPPLFAVSNIPADFRRQPRPGPDRDRER
jgi:hypothetical protein